jgi:hypothetical protein
MPFTFNSDAQCPKCGSHSFTSPSNPSDIAPVICDGCGYTTTVEETITTLRANLNRPQPRYGRGSRRNPKPPLRQGVTDRLVWMCAKERLSMRRC